MVAQNLLDKRQWAYRKEKSTEQLLMHLTERQREAVERKLFVGIPFVDFTKAFDTVWHNILRQKLNDLDIRGDIWLWLKTFLTKRRQFARINGCDSDTLTIAQGVPQRSVLGPTLLWSLRKRPPKITTLCGNLSVCRRHNNILIAEAMDLLINALNNVLAERQEWCDRNLMVPHPEKCKAMILQWKSIFTGPIQVFRLDVNNIIKWTTPERLLGVQVDNKLSLSDHAVNVAKSLASNSIRSLLRRMRFLPRKISTQKWYCHQLHKLWQ